jgi:hypothetical protein
LTSRYLIDAAAGAARAADEASIGVKLGSDARAYLHFTPILDLRERRGG